MCILRESEGDNNAGVVEECEYMGGTCGSGFVSTVDDILEMSVVRGVDGVCVKSVCVWLGVE